jgi:FkbM family methyltransferase
MANILAWLFEKFPEIPFKNRMREFLAFNPIVPRFVSDISPLKGYELYYHLKPGDIVVDAGAFTGDYAIFAAKRVGPSGSVIAFEPDEKNRAILARNMNHDKISNMTIIPKGLWNKNTFLSSSSFGLHTTLSDKTDSNKIQVVKLDDELKSLGIKKLDFLKMDIEGAEIQAIQGSLDTLRKFKPKIAIASYHIVNGKPTSVFLEKFLSKLGYNVKSDFSKHTTTYAW